MMAWTDTLKKAFRAFGSRYISYDYDQLLLQYRRNAGVGNLMEFIVTDENWKEK